MEFVSRARSAAYRGTKWAQERAQSRGMGRTATVLGRVAQRLYPEGEGK